MTGSRPRADIASRRLAGLVRLLRDDAARPRVVLTTVNAVVQRVPPRAMLADAAFPLAAGAALEVAALLDYLEGNGFARTGTVMEAGDYAVRGGIIDIFPPSAERPVRLDFFGDTLETIRWFDPMSQRSAESASAVDLVPVSEVLLDPDSIARFRAAYRKQFGAVTGGDPLYEAISAGRRYPGLEHWLPFFHDRLETLFDYLPESAIVLDHRVEEARDDRFEAIADFHAARARPQASAIADAPLPSGSAGDAFSRTPENGGGGSTPTGSSHARPLSRRKAGPTPAAGTGATSSASASRVTASCSGPLADHIERQQESGPAGARRRCRRRSRQRMIRDASRAWCSRDRTGRGLAARAGAAPGHRGGGSCCLWSAASSRPDWRSSPSRTFSARGRAGRSVAAGCGPRTFSPIRRRWRTAISWSTPTTALAVTTASLPRGRPCTP